jgi:hypothetical protein
MKNPPAFPSAVSNPLTAGMTLLDYFAAQCIFADHGGQHSPADFAKTAYTVAAAMIAEREKHV